MAQRGGRNPAKYRQIADDLRARMERGEWAVDAKMPTQQELAAQYGDVALGTVDKALGVLRDLGMAETVQGMGTFVRKPPPSAGDLTEQVNRLRERVVMLEDQENAELRTLRHEVAVLRTYIIDLYTRMGYPYPREMGEQSQRAPGDAKPDSRTA